MPITEEQFLNIFGAYNSAVFPMQFFLAAAALAAVFLTIKTSRNSGKIVAALLALLWLWMGVAYHIVFFSRINPAAYLFGAFFVLQAAILFYAGVLKNELSFHFRFDLNGAIGISLILYALFVYPFLGFIFGHVYPQSPTFGLPCPTTIFTFGLLLWTDKKPPWYALPIPLLWSLVGFSAAFLLEIYEDFALPFAGIAAMILSLWRSGLKNFGTKPILTKGETKNYRF